MGAAGLSVLGSPDTTRTPARDRDAVSDSRQLLSSIPKRRPSTTNSDEDTSVLLPKVLELAMLEQALQRDLDEDDALDEQLKQTARRVAALEKAAADARARRAKRKKKRMELEDSTFV
jgi:vacuolar-type H+-ATPase subunit D/Vma8